MRMVHDRKSYIIRQARPNDADGLAVCMKAAYQGYQSKLNGIELPPMTIDYNSEIRDFPTWVAINDEQIVGGLTLIFEKNHASIVNIAVSPDFQGQGLGKALMNYAESRATENRYSELRLATHVLLTENVSLYRYLGWEEYDRDDNRVHMKKHV